MRSWKQLLRIAEGAARRGDQKLLDWAAKEMVDHDVARAAVWGKPTRKSKD